MNDIIMSVKEAEALDAEMAALMDSNTKLTAELASAKTAGEKIAGIDKIAEAVTDVLVEKKMVSADKVAETRAALSKDGGIPSYFKKACDLYLAAAAGKKEADDRFKQIPTRVGRVPVEKTGSEQVQVSTSTLKQAEDRFAQRILTAR